MEPNSGMRISSKRRDGPDGEQQAKPTFNWWAWLVATAVIMVLNYVVAAAVLPAQTQRIELPYSTFKQQVEASNVARVSSQGDTIQGSFKTAITYTPEGGKEAQTGKDFSTVLPTFAGRELEGLLDQHGVTVNATSIETPRPWWLTALISFGPTLLLIGGFMALSRMGATQAAGGMFGLGRSKAQRYEPAGADRVTFDDVAGIDEAKAELVEVVDFLKAPAKYTRLGGTAPKGVLLVGPPGTGKTLLARAVAGEAGVPFFSMGASEFVEMVVGVGASRVRDLFRQAKEAAPAIVFIDELDAIGRARGGNAFAQNDEREQTLNQILSEMDGFSSRQGVIVLAATNRADVLDPALLRAGRFDRRVFVSPPDKIGREAILHVHTRGVPLAPDVNLKAVAGATAGLVGADIHNLVNEAALLAARRNEEAIHQQDILDALEKLVMGPARRLLMLPDERERIAYHESGHTILGLVVPGADPVGRVTIIPRGQALGVTYQVQEDERHNYGEDYLRARIVGALGGRAAEEVVYGSRTTGAENDMEVATDLARQMVTRWGMSDKLGPVTLARRDGTMLGGSPALGLQSGGMVQSEATARLVDEEVQGILLRCNEQSVALLRQHRPQLNALAMALLERETLEEQEILSVTGLSHAKHPESLPLPAAAFSAA